MKKIKKILVHILLILTLGCLLAGCGGSVPTEKDLDKAYEKVQDGKMNVIEYYEMADAYYNNEPYKSDGGFFSFVGNAVLFVAVGGVIVVVVKKFKDKK